MLTPKFCHWVAREWRKRNICEIYLYAFPNNSSAILWIEILIFNDKIFTIMEGKPKDITGGRMFSHNSQTAIKWNKNCFFPFLFRVNRGGVLVNFRFIILRLWVLELEIYLVYELMSLVQDPRAIKYLTWCFGINSPRNDIVVKTLRWNIYDVKCDFKKINIWAQYFEGFTSHPIFLDALES